MNQAILDGFEQTSAHLACPLCKQPLSLAGTSLRCTSGHCFDLARQGYVNLLPGAKQQKNYDLASFENRHVILDGGFYAQVLEGVSGAVAEALQVDGVYDASGCEEPTRVPVILDAGCGEGYYAQHLASTFDAQIIAMDISKASILLSAKNDPERRVRWLVGDLANLPLRNQSVDIVLDIFSPANYAEFRRVLRPRGVLIKVVPGSQHLAELRERAKDQLRSESYSNERIKTHLQESGFSVVSQVRAVRTSPLSPDELEALIGMTPLLFNADHRTIDRAGLDHITIDAEIIVAVQEHC